jgi:hypothetical protein
MDKLAFHRIVLQVIQASFVDHYSCHPQLFYAFFASSVHAGGACYGRILLGKPGDQFG